ncbi:MAG: PIN domain protein [Candidatus Bathyarchaeota archaeon BA1]|nr:MAG: PIN domain protein [Candidatus Bathyarchaeota archaeon BA1]
MPVIELDMLIAFVNPLDKHHAITSNLFMKIRDRQIKNVSTTASAYLEYQLIHKARGYGESEIRRDLEMFRVFPNLGERNLSLNILIKASELRDKYGLSFFDSLHAATAMLTDQKVISSNQTYDRIAGLVRLDPQRL